MGVPVKKRLRVVDNDRNLGRYAEFKDSYGADVKVSQSSSAEGPHVWLFIKGGGANRPDHHLTEKGEAATHLSLAQAALVRDALSEWLEDFAPRAPKRCKGKRSE